MVKKDITLYSYFNPRRFRLLLKRDMVSGYRAVLIAVAAVAGVAIIISALSMLGAYEADFHYGIFYPLLFAGGYIVTSLAFRDLHLNGRSYTYLMLPGSRVEKFTSKLLTTSVGYALGTLILCSVLSLVSEGINKLIFGHSHLLFNPFNREVLLAVAIYLVTQSIFLVGAAYFKKLAILKTALAVNIAVIGFSILSGGVLAVVFRNYIVAGKQSNELRAIINELGHSGWFEAAFLPAGRAILLGLKIFFWGIMAPVCWVISYVRFSEKEV